MALNLFFFLTPFFVTCCHSGNLFYLDVLTSNMEICLAKDMLCQEHGSVGDLTRLDGVEVGFRREINLGEYGNKTMITRAMRPLLFEIPNFLTSEECDYMIQRAKDSGMFTSTTNRFPREKEKKFNFNILGKAEGFRGEWETWDRNGDKLISLEEVLKYAQDYRRVYLDKKELTAMIRNLSLHEMDDGWITQQEFQTMNTLLLDNYLLHIRQTHPIHKSRYSEQAFVEHRDPSDKIFSGIIERLSKLTKLPRQLVEESEPLQVVRYTKYGHYNAHYDSEYSDRINIPCCQQIEPQIFETSLKEPVCKLCRYLTIGYYLNDVPSGGGTAFPIADNGSYHQEAMYEAGINRYQLVSFCNNANLIVKPQKGKAVMWYNHFVDENGWLGARDEFSLHGGCGVKEGEKWFANNWIYAPYDKYKHLPNMWTFRSKQNW